MSTKFLLINVTNPEKYIEKANSGIKSKLMHSNHKMYGTPLSIASNTLKYDFEALNELLQEALSKHKKQTL